MKKIEYRILWQAPVNEKISSERFQVRGIDATKLS